MSSSPATGRRWDICDRIGEGSYGEVYLARPLRPLVPPLAVKIADVLKARFLAYEQRILEAIGDCPEIVHCYGGGMTLQDAGYFYHLYLEYAAGGTLLDLMKKRGGKLPVWEVRRYAGMIVRGLCHIHAKGYVHCDIKPSNLLIFPASANTLKIADFGLAKMAGTHNWKGCRCTPAYASPESVRGLNEAPMDIWALGCVVVEMFTGKPAWSGYGDVNELVYQIGCGKELPEIPEGLSAEGKDFVSKCLVREASKRWTAQRLLTHPFLAEKTDLLTEFVTSFCRLHQRYQLA